MTGPDPEKGQRYSSALDTARCQNRWDEVPELIRKVTKHAPQKTCYQETARAESRVTTYNSQQRPSSSQSASSDLFESTTALLPFVENAHGFPQELFQAQVCLGWIHWTLNEPRLAASRLPKDFGETVDTISNDGQQLSPWTQVCLVKGCYIKCAGQASYSAFIDALETVDSLIPWLSSHIQAASSNPQFSHWSEKLLAKGALLAGDQICANAVVVDDGLVTTTLTLFRLWSAHPNAKQSVSSHGAQNGDSAGPASKLTIWKSYYDVLTAIVQHNLPYVATTNGPERPQLANEIRRVESICETNILREVKFPTANSRSSQIEDWVEQVIMNWEVLCGPHWRDEDLGEGGQSAFGRNVLDILYRAATKTYHSHLILRRLFHVHSASAEFDLALKALDSYIEIVTNAKERAEKGAESGELENEGTLLKTLSEGVTMLCCFGSEKEAEKARDLAMLIQNIVAKHAHDDANDRENGELSHSYESNTSDSGRIPPAIIATAYKAIGIGLANWANWTPVTESRDDIRAEAIESLERSVAPELQDELNNSSLYTLALLLAEDRDLDGAIDYVKLALTSNTHPTTQPDLTRERDLVALWHLLALLLSAKHDFTMAEHSCEAAFEQFPAAVTSHNQNEKRSQKQLQDAQNQLDAVGLKHALIDHLQGREKERIIETRVTQLAFVEVLEGPEAAVNHSHQLLGLFATLFRNLDLEADDNKNAKPKGLRLLPPKSSAGTVKSFRGSIFSRNRASRPPERILESGSEYNPSTTQLPSINDAAPAIQVTDEDRNHPESGERALGKSNSVKQKFRKRANSAKNPDNTPKHDGGLTDGHGHPAAAGAPQNEEEANNQHMVGLAVSESVPSSDQDAKQPLWPIVPQLKDSHQPLPAGYRTESPEQDVRLPTSYRFDSPTNAVTRFPISQAQKHALGILVKIWLLISGLYRRATLFGEAQEACEEASKQITRIEALVAAQNASAKSFSHRGWGVTKSPDELWAELHAEQGFLSKVQSRPHDAIEHFETALTRDPDHPKATIGLANLLLDIWDQTLHAEPPRPEVKFDASTLSLLSVATKRNHMKPAQSPGISKSRQSKDFISSSQSPDEEPKFLNRVAARDRAYGLLSSLTKRGNSWDNSEAWYALSRAYEAGGQIEKLKEVLWWCIELEDRRPIRHWSNIGSGVYVL